jgi:hypothetical protein
MDSTLQRIVHDLIGRISGPMQFRLYLQPGMAMIQGIRDGLKDARTNQPPYFWSIFTTPGRRAELLKEGLKSVARVMLFAIVMDAVYQYIELRTFHIGEAVIVALVLGFIPYLLIRGPVNRIAKWSASHRSPDQLPKYRVSK